MTQVSEDLRDAMGVLDERGWCQGAAQPNVDGNVCLEAALAQVTMGTALAWSERPTCTIYPETDMERQLAAIKALREALPDEVKVKAYKYFGMEGREYDIWWWNDLESTTVEDVKLLMKRAIETEEAKA